MPNAACIMLCWQLLELVMLSLKSVLCSHYAQLCNGFILWPRGQATCYKLNMADYGCMQL